MLFDRNVIEFLLIALKHVELLIVKETKRQKDDKNRKNFLHKTQLERGNKRIFQLNECRVSSTWFYFQFRFASRTISQEQFHSWFNRNKELTFSTLERRRRQRRWNLIRTYSLDSLSSTRDEWLNQEISTSSPTALVIRCFEFH